MRRAGNGTVGSNPTLSATHSTHFPLPPRTTCNLPKIGRVIGHYCFVSITEQRLLLEYPAFSGAHSPNAMRSVPFPFITGNLQRIGHQNRPFRHQSTTRPRENPANPVTSCSKNGLP